MKTKNKQETKKKMRKNTMCCCYFHFKLNFDIYSKRMQRPIAHTQSLTYCNVEKTVKIGKNFAIKLAFWLKCCFTQTESEAKEIFNRFESIWITDIKRWPLISEWNTNCFRQLTILDRINWHSIKIDDFNVCSNGSWQFGSFSWLFFHEIILFVHIHRVYPCSCPCI